MTTAADRLTPDELRTLFLFAALDDGQLAWLAEHGRVEQRAGGTVVYGEGEAATCFFVLLRGAVSLHRQVGGDEVEVSRTDQRGVYGGATQAYLDDQVEQVYRNSMRAVTDAEFFVLPAEDFAHALRSWFPMAMHLLEGLFFGMRDTQKIVGERERLLALGSLSAGLTHELNNPAGAAVRATAVLRDRVAGMRHKLALIADGRLDGSALHRLVELQEEAVARVATAPKLSPMAAADAEDAVADWLDEHEVRAGWDLAPTLVAGGLDAAWLDRVQPAVGRADLESAVRWLTYTVDTELLIREIGDAVTRISGLVGAAKQYSQLDRAPFQVVDVHDLLDATLVMFKAKIPADVRVVREYDRGLPPVPAYAAELNQVWTNLIDNALGAMGDRGVLTLRTAGAGDQLMVEVADTGPGIPPEIRPRIFEPFFTTKPVGSGTGLGLDISYRIVVRKHRGDIRVESAPGMTIFRVLLPLAAERPPNGRAGG
ncbi:cyclic nucleotide-binding protein [Micromonospora kangleipakensis]|uniref:histidine kinase n=1 Tax=Micromonospora kangleipakensis TaxID=1077942 RepID=A0A4Q8BE09_9ACTN|nr:ATP-binding protein [Micromonospora kangleipakensis]RZU75359.1 cyclic nucleotide-binding protein [Micromonospora kangleipakensis]